MSSWYVEREVAAPQHYLATDGVRWYWTEDRLEALTFSRKQDAEAGGTYILGTISGVKIVEYAS